MIRSLAALCAGLFVCAGLVGAQELRIEKKQQREEKREERREARPPVVGAYESYRDGVLVLKVEGKAFEVRVGPDVKTTVWAATGEPRDNVPARDGFRDLRPGTPVRVTWGEGDRVGGVTIGTPREREK